MPRFRSWDGTELAYRVSGSGPPLLCIPGGPSQAAEYLGDLGGLSAQRTLILLDNRGTGASQIPQDPVTYRVDQLVRDVEALRDLLGLDRMDLLGHSASGGTRLLYAAAHPDRLDHLVLVAPSLRVTGLPSDLGVDEVLAQRADEPWYAEAVAALYAEAASPRELERYRRLAAPLLYGQWNDAAQAQAAAEPAQFPSRRRTGSTPASPRIRRCPSGSQRWRCGSCSWRESTTSGQRTRPSAGWPLSSATPSWHCCREPGTSPG